MCLVNGSTRVRPFRITCLSFTSMVSPPTAMQRLMKSWVGSTGYWNTITSP